MILIDFNQIAMTSMHAGYAKQISGGVFNADITRHIILNMIRSINTKFSKKYGNIIIAADSRQSWRKVMFPAYKAHRKGDRAKLEIDWASVFELFTSIKNELLEYSAWPIIEVQGAEGDDVIAVLALKYSGQPNIIISADGDFKQLQAHVQVDQYDPIHSRYITADCPETYLFEHLIKGDRGDGVPNILSDDDTFINPAKRQGKVTDKRMTAWKETDISEWSVSEQRNFARNKRLIDLREQPPKLVANIEAEYLLQSSRDRVHRMYDYLMDYKLINLLDCVNDFSYGPQSCF